MLSQSPSRTLTKRMKNFALKGTVKRTEMHWKRFSPNHPFSPHCSLYHSGPSWNIWRQYQIRMSFDYVCFEKEEDDIPHLRQCRAAMREEKNV
mmetsp:Transcript_6558/g.11895  ORF Transcript_6558/g.11895 Transcript_6558/m.11895 type:complete len:93 (-) Transcript_6558:256-534(-)